MLGARAPPSTAAKRHWAWLLKTGRPSRHCRGAGDQQVQERRGGSLGTQTTFGSWPRSSSEPAFAHLRDGGNMAPGHGHGHRREHRCSVGTLSAPSTCSLGRGEPLVVTPQCHLGTVLGRSLFTDWRKKAGLQRRQCTLAKEATGEEWGCGGRGGRGGHLVLCAHHQHRELTQQPLKDIGPPTPSPELPGSPLHSRHSNCSRKNLQTQCTGRSRVAAATPGARHPRPASLLLHEEERGRRAMKCREVGEAHSKQ